MEVMLLKTAGGALVPVGDEEAEKLKRFKAGDIARLDITKVRNPVFHRKFMLLVKFAYDIWCETAPRRQYKGLDIHPNFTRFRKDLTILCGYFDATFNVRGETRLEAKSISFASMEQDEFEGLYSKAIDVILERILNRPDLTPEKVRAHVDTLMRFDS